MPDIGLNATGILRERMVFNVGEEDCDAMVRGIYAAHQHGQS